MAHFRGILRGNRGEASRLGSKDSGLRVEAQSWQGKVVVVLETQEDGTDVAWIAFQKHSGKGTERLLWHGPVGGMPEVTPEPKEMWRHIQNGSLHETLPSGIDPVSRQPQYEKVLVLK